MNALFYQARNFNQDISGWDTGNVTEMQNMFREASDFNQDISGWNTSNVTGMSNMFRDATSFNQEIGGWDVRSVDAMTSMFQNASSFNGNLSSWCVSHNPSHGSFSTGSALTAGNLPQWGSSCVPTVILTDTDGDNLLGSGAIVTITAIFDQDMANSPQYSINSGSSYLDLTAGGNASTWTHQLIANNLSDGAYTFLVSGTSVGGVSYDLSQGTQDGDETEVDKITFTVDRTPPTVVLSDSDSDNLLSASDTVIVTANFSEAMNADPTLSMSGGLISGANMIATGDPSTWTYTINVSSLGASDGDYQVSVSGTDLAGNAYAGSESITFTIDVTLPTVILTDTDSDDIVFPDTTMTVTANFSEAMQQTPTISLGSVIVDAEMSPTGSLKEWTYFIDFSTLTITPGTYAITVGGRDLSGNLYSSLEGVLDGDETSTDKIEIDFQKFIPTITASDVTRIYVNSTDPQFTLGVSSTSTGTLTFEAGGILNGKMSDGAVAILLLLYMYGIGKAALMPIHRWLPAAMVAPTPVSALLHAVAVVKAGVFTVPGDGCIDYDSIFQTLKDNNYKGWFVVEAEQDPAKANPFEYAKIGYKYLTETLNLSGIEIYKS